MTALKCNNLKWLSQCEKRYAKYVHMFIYVFYLFFFLYLEQICICNETFICNEKSDL